jgi:hypothetical protein
MTGVTLKNRLFISSYIPEILIVKFKKIKKNGRRNLKTICDFFIHSRNINGKNREDK